MKQLGVLLLPLNGMLAHHRIPKHEVLLSLDRVLVCHREPKQGVLLLPLDGMLDHHRIPKHEVTGSVTTLPEWDASPSQDTQTRSN